jgi:DNA-3-methyladenine glycosylase II
MPRSEKKTLAVQADLDRAIRALVRRDPRLAPVVAAAGMPALRRREPGFAGLARIIVGQQLSTASASAIWARLAAAFDPFLPQAIRRATSARLGRLGLSAAKIKTLKLIAADIVASHLDLDGLASLDADAAHATLTALHGVGPWTADVYLLFCLGHRDAWPAADLAIQEGIRVGLGLERRPTTKETIALGDAWRPYRGAAAHLWWAYVRAGRRREGTAARPARQRVRPVKIATSPPEPRRETET